MKSNNTVFCRLTWGFVATLLLIASGNLYSQIRSDAIIPTSDEFLPLPSITHPHIQKNHSAPNESAFSYLEPAVNLRGESATNRRTATGKKPEPDQRSASYEFFGPQSAGKQVLLVADTHFQNTDETSSSDLDAVSTDFVNSSSAPSLGSPFNEADHTNNASANELTESKTNELTDSKTLINDNPVEESTDQSAFDIRININDENKINDEGGFSRFSKKNGKTAPEMIHIPFSDPQPQNSAPRLGAGGWRNRFGAVFANGRFSARVSDNNGTISAEVNYCPSANTPVPKPTSGVFSGIVSDDNLKGVAERHPWGRFPEGSWKRLQETTELYTIENGRTRKNFSSAEHTLTLCAAEPEQYRLVWESSMIGSSRRWSAPPKITTTNYWDEKVELTPISYQIKDNQTIVLEGTSYPCRWEKILFGNAEWQVEIETWRSDKSLTMPVVLRQLRRTYALSTDPFKPETSHVETVQMDAKKPNSDVSVTVSGKDSARSKGVRQLTISTEYLIAPTPSLFSVLGCVQQVWKATQKDVSINGRVETTSLISLEAPGEIISYETLQYDKSGTLLGKISGKMLDYGFGSQDASGSDSRKGLLNFKIWHRPNLFRNNQWTGG